MKKNGKFCEIAWFYPVILLTFTRVCDKIESLNRGANEHEYLRHFFEIGKLRAAAGKGYLRRSATLPAALGIRVNTRLTVTVVKHYLFLPYPLPILAILQGFLGICCADGVSRPFLF